MIYNNNLLQNIMRSQIQNKFKQRPINLSQTAQLNSGNESPTKQQFFRYRRSSLPNSIGQYSMNVRNSCEEQSTQIYFNPKKKSKFMKQIVDNYFQETLQKIYGTQKQSNYRQVKTLQRNINNIAKRGKVFFSSIQVAKQKQKRQMQKTGKGPSNPKQISEQQQGELYQSISSSTNTTSTFLPPIFESHEDGEDLGKIFPQMSEVSSEVNIKQQKLQQHLTFQNEAFKIYVVSSNGIPKYRIKEFKPPGLEILKREQRISKFGIQRIWKQSQISSNCFRSQIVHPLKNMICKMTPHLEGNVKFKIRSSSYRRYLLQNNCQQLRQFLRQLCVILKKIQGRVLNNKINPSNIFILKGNRICIGEWGYSSFRDEYQIQHNKFQSRINPILKSSKQWLATPEYLSPELLKAVLAESEQEQPDIWEHTSSSDIWSLGITLFEIITMVPIWMNQSCSLKLKSKKAIVRTGLLGTDDRKLTKIADKQRKIEKQISKCLQMQAEECVGKQIVELVCRMVTYDPIERITLNQIMNIIK